MNRSNREYPDCPSHAYLYGTCLVDLFFPEAGMDALSLLESCGIHVTYPQAQTCCGQPAYTSGYERPAIAVAKSQIDLFPEPWPVIVLSGSCAGMMRHNYPRLLKDEPQWQQKAEALSERVFELTEFLVNVADFKPDDIGLPEQVTLHTSCTARREMQVHESGAKLVDGCQNVDRLQQNHESECFGISGVNFAVAETGTLCLVENEGNGRMTTTVPPVHIAVTGIEKVVEKLSEIPPLLTLLTRSATGQPISTYFNMITSPRKLGELDGSEEVHLVLLDNGRSQA